MEEVHCAEKNSKEIIIKANYQGKEISNLEYKYWTGAGNKFIKLKDGISSIPYTDEKKIKVWIEYEYEKNKNEIKAISEFWDKVIKAKYENTKLISLDKKENKSIEYEIKTVGETKNRDKIHNEILNLMISIENNKFNYDKKLNKKLSSLSKFCDMKKISNVTEGEIVETYDGFEYRSLYVKTKYDSINMEATEGLVLDFDKDGNLKDVNLSLNKEIINYFNQKEKELEIWKEKQVILKFIEKYRTAFLTRDIETMKDIFSDSAVIIVGNIRKSDEKITSQFKDKEKAEYNKYTKDEYLKNLERMFNSRDDIFLDFYNMNIEVKNGKDGVYGMSMRQNFNSSTYSDEGYLFLLVDFNKKEPQIQIRSWQPEEWTSEDLNNLSKFDFFK